MAIQETCEAVGRALNEEWAELHPDDELRGPVEVYVEDNAVNYNGSPPRVIFLIGAERWLTHRDQASQDAFVADENGKIKPVDKNRKRRILFTRRCQVEVHVWGLGRTPTEELLATTVRACWGVAMGSFGIDGGTWKSRSATKLGNLYVLTVWFDIPVNRLKDPTVPVEFENDGVIDDPTVGV